MKRKSSFWGRKGVCLLLCFSSLVWAEMPTEVNPPSFEDAKWLIETLMAEEPLLLKPFKFPKDVDRSDAEQTLLLNFWHEKGLLDRGEIRFNAYKEVYGKRRRVSVAGYRYTLPEEHPGVTGDGFIYGSARIKRILKISKPSFIGHTFFCEAATEWYVVDMPEWSRDPLMLQSYRELRRSQESYEKPFERPYYFEYQEDVGWILWKKKPAALSQPLF